MCVYFCCADGAVSKYLLYVPDIDVLFQQERGKGVAEHMGGNMLADTGKLCIAVYHKADRLVREFVLQPVDKEVPADGDIFLKGFLVQK